MGTRSRIGVMHGDVVKSIYCHWDGYLENNGAILQKHYDSAKANNLVALGDMSSLRPEIGEKHAFSQFEMPAEDRAAFEQLTENWCTFYGRDRGEEDVSWKVAHSFADFLEQVENCGAEYYYIMKDGVWYAGCVYEVDGLVKQGLVPLAEALEKQAEEEAV
jgi:hypothetical protein